MIFLHKDVDKKKLKLILVTKGEEETNKIWIDQSNNTETLPNGWRGGVRDETSPRLGEKRVKELAKWPPRFTAEDVGNKKTQERKIDVVRE